MHLYLLMKIRTVLNENAHIDNTSGWGSTPMNSDVDYFGLTVYMKPSVFLHLARFLAREKATTADGIVQHIKGGGKIAAPFLRVSVPEDIENEYASVMDHEGRNRMHALYELNGDIPTQVHIFPSNGMRSRHLTPEIIKMWKRGMYAEGSGHFISGPLFTTKGN